VDVFDRFAAEADGPVPNWVGVATRRDIIQHDRRIVEFRLRPDLDDLDVFEWESVVEAVMQASRKVTVIELGAGWARWVVNAAAVTRAWGHGLRYRLLAVEAEPSHHRYGREHCRRNNVRRRGREGSCELLRAAVTVSPGKVEFAIGNPSGWYGQAIADETWSPEQTETVKAITLSSLLARFDRVDLIHADIQGAELAVFTEAAPLANVRRVHIGTHNAEVEGGLRSLFNELGWEGSHDLAAGSTTTVGGRALEVQDGIQVWLNTALSA
jgi:FkbM family methyltransferase